MKLNLFKLLLFFLFPGLFCAQSYKNDIISVGRNFVGAKNYSMTMHYRLYLDGDYSKAFQERFVEVKKMDKNLLIVHNTGFMTLDNEKFQIVINEKNKVFSAIKKDQVERIDSSVYEFNSFLTSNFDSLMKVYDKITVIQNNNEQASYEMTFKPNDMVEKVTLVIDKTNKMYKSLTIKYKQPFRAGEDDNRTHFITLKIDYLNFRKDVVKSSEIFDDRKYITVSKEGKIIPVKKYAGYKLIIPNEI